MLTPTEIEKKLKEEKNFLSQHFFVEKIGYFGSFATNTYHLDSDVDILVNLRQGAGWTFFDLKEYLEAKLGQKVDLVTENSIRGAWKEQILQQVKYI